MKKSRLDYTKHLSYLLLSRTGIKTVARMLTVLLITVSSFQMQAKDSIGLENISIENESVPVKRVLKEGRQILLYAVRSSMTENKLPEHSGSWDEIAFSVSGLVSDDQNQPVPGVNILEKGTTNGTATDNNGQFKISVSDPNATLVFSFIGFVTQEIQVNSQTVINLSIIPDILSLSEVVVVGYGTQKKVNLTGAVSSVSSETLKNRPIINLGQGLQGLIPNLNISLADGAAGSGATFNIRGFTSTNGGSPLILVDGVVMDPNLVNPSEIESVSVLKDAASSAIYGSRAAFGVILITTKKGAKSKKPVIELSSNYSLNAPTDIPDLMDSRQLIEFAEAKADNLGLGEPFGPETKALLLAHYNDPANNPAARINPNDPTRYEYFGNSDWFEAIMKPNSPVSQTNLAIRGGTDAISYYVSGGLLSQDGILKYGNDSYNRYNLRTKLSIQATKWLDFNINTIITRTNQDNIYNYAGIGTIWHDLTRESPYMPIYNPDGTYAESPVALLANGGRDLRYTTDSWLTLGSVVKPMEHLTVTGSYSFNAYGMDRSQHKKKVDRFYGPKELSTPLTVHTTPTALFLNGDRQNYYAVNIYADYERTLAGKHYLKATVGYNEEKRDFNYTNSSNQNLLTDQLPSLNLTTGTATAGEYKTAWALQGYFYRLNYIYNEKYLLEVNGRYDATSRFPKEDRWAFFPSVSAGWRVSNEPFFEPLSGLFSDLKFRASYGQLGNQTLLSNADFGNQSLSSNFPYLPTMGAYRPSVILAGDRPLSVGAPSLVSSNLTWETAISKDVGLDAAMVNSKLQLSFDYFERKVVDQLGPGSAVPASLGTGAPAANAVESVTKGWELEVKWRDRIGNVGYDIGFNIADAQGEITKYNNPTKSLTVAYYEGRKIGEIWGYQTNGLFDSREQYLSSGLNYSNRTGLPIDGGDVYYVDQDGNGIINTGISTVGDPGDWVIIGNSTPRYTYGISLGSQWKNLSLSIFMQGVGKRDLDLGGSLFWPNEGGTLQVNHQDYWTEENTDAYWPRALGSQGGFNYATSDRYLQNFAYLRMKQLTLSYSLDQALLSKTFIGSLQIYFTGQNLFEIHNVIDGFDPEISSGGFNGWGPGKSYPFSRSYSLGINLSF